MENKTLGLSEIMISVAIFFPIVIKYFLRIYKPEDVTVISFKWFSLAGIYLLIYVLFSINSVDNKLTRMLVYTNLIISSFMIGFLSLIEEVEKFPPLLSKLIVAEFWWAGTFNFLIIPLILLVLGFYFLLFSK